MEIDRNGLEVLARRECLRLASTVHVGRIGLSLNALPVIFTVNFALDGGDGVVFRTRPGTKLTSAIAGNVVCFQADCLDDAGEFGWSVNITGQALVVDEEAPRLDALELPNLFVDGDGETH
ncbi:MAG TPA: pyridoxamine 5'-phosphate oxidase family protein, partial [Acidimicrobiales bacterium]|nr:pyridoxamine 5'-phosphate oxidase family protein [Acidimicrobiales bacterium]